MPTAIPKATAARIKAGAGAFTLAGKDGNLLRGYVLLTAAGAFALTGQDVELLRGYLLEVEPGVFVLTGLPATLNYSGELQQREVLSWVAESNALSRGALEKGGAERYKTYRVYDLD